MSCWNHGNAHFLRGVVGELLDRDHDVEVYEPHDGWSLAHLRQDEGEAPVRRFQERFPHLRSRFYDFRNFDVAAALDDADVVIVHEWNEPALVAAIGRHRARHGGYRLLFHDTHHRSVTAREDMARYDLQHYDGVLAYGEIIRQIYLENAWAADAWTWHEAADVHLFRPIPNEARRGELIWIGNWGDDERTAELHEFFLQPVSTLGLKANAYGVRYPDGAGAALAEAGVAYHGWLPNAEAPAVFAAHRVTIHVPRRPYVEALAGIPTIRPFEAMAAGIPLVSAPWDDAEGLFRTGTDYLMARDGREMTALLREVLHDDELAASLIRHGRETILARHTCGHRAEELLAIVADLAGEEPKSVVPMAREPLTGTDA